MSAAPTFQGDGVTRYLRRIAELEVQLQDANDTLEAIATGQVDAVVVGAGPDTQVYTLQSADRPYRLLIEQMAEGAVTLSGDGAILYCNAAFAEMVGRPASDLTGTLFANHLDDQDAARFAPMGRDSKLEAGLKTEPGTVIPVQISLSSLDSEDEALICGVVTDLSAARLQATELAEAKAGLTMLLNRRMHEDQLSFALAAGKLGSWVLDLSDLGLKTSDICKTIFGRRAEDDFSYADLRDAVHPGDRDRMAEAVQAAIQSGSDYGITYRIIRPDGLLRWVQIDGRPSYAEDGSPLRMTGVSQDVTDRVEREAQLTGLSQSLERRVVERTEELQRTEAALRQSQKIEAMGQLTGGVAHDFNNLLAAIMGNIELVQKRLPVETDPRVRRMLDGAMQGAERGAALTSRLLAFARRQELNAEPVSIADMAVGMDDLLSRTLGPAITIEIDIPGDLPAVNADRHQLELALLNLAVNARDAMAGGGRLIIAAGIVEDRPQPDLAPGRYVGIRVADTGEGMDTETQRRASEPFFTTKGVGKGTGLGLSMVHGLMAQFGGAMTITSTPGIGTEVTLWLPQWEGEPALAAAPAAETPLEDGPLLRLLFVDDDPLVRESTQAMLDEMGHTVEVASSAKIALETLSSDPGFDLVITDYAMPDMTGAELIGEIGLRWPTLKTLLATGYAEAPAGTTLPNPRLTKPFRRDDVSRALHQARQS